MSVPFVGTPQDPFDLGVNQQIVHPFFWVLNIFIVLLPFFIRLGISFLIFVYIYIYMYIYIYILLTIFADLIPRRSVYVI